MGLQVVAFVTLAALTALSVALAAFETVFPEDRNAVRGRHLSEGD
ncbi:hypothetical protein [Halomarina rubra]|uniref:Uncharacterized protein n=1 Tax=Halomarina rubra TaxID=2071873 RepID=A0ABD6ASR0_9EURY|nr:hypothetical protein [Halomarina rubra]